MSTILIGFTMWAAGAMGLCFAFTFLESLIFAAVISATDPVSVLSVFQRLQAHPYLYTLVFGESIFNDAVAIVLFRSLLTFLKKDVTFKLAMFEMLTFVEIFVCSMLIGIAYGFIASLAFRTDVFRNKPSPVEASLVVLLALCSFSTSESLGQSRIVAILFCGMMMAKYARPNLSRTAENRSVRFFKILAYMSETFDVIYIGTMLFIRKEAWNEGMMWAFLVVALFAMAHSRFFNVYANSKLANSLRPEEMHVPKTHQSCCGFRVSGVPSLSLWPSGHLPKFSLGIKHPLAEYF
ncbi:hypothetical protein BSKO_09278 [Bryopsis sp. KO-2023]|nr:hypothetical protein BSKO_09278 [Bryopsis sp. KO-2023]